MSNWKQHADVSTPAPSVSAAVKTGTHPFHRKHPRKATTHPCTWHQNVRVLDRTFNYNPRRAKELLRLFLEFHPDIRFHLEIHPALLSEELKEELSLLPKGLLHLEAGIQSLREPVLEKSRRMGKLSDALDGLRFLCALPNMETHADLIAGLPLYHLHEIFEDVRTLAGYAAGEIQLESLKLLPGTEMRRRAEELGIKYSPLPPYEVLQTHEISVSELQTARQLSRLLDGFYNTPAWQTLTRELILNDKQFLHRFLAYLTKVNLIDQPMSLEKRGLILYEFCKQNYPEYQIQATIAWIEAGMSLKNSLPRKYGPNDKSLLPLGISFMENTKKAFVCVSFLPMKRGNMATGSALSRRYKKQVLYSRQERKTLLHQEKLLVSKSNARF